MDGRGSGAADAGSCSVGCGPCREHAQQRRYRVDADLDGARTDDDHPRRGVVLRRHGPQDERAGDGDAELCRYLPRHGAVDGDRLQLRLHLGIAVPGRGQSLSAIGDDPRRAQRSRKDDPGIGLYDVSDDLCDHHSVADLRRLRRSHEVFGVAVVHRAVGGLCLRAHRSLGVGARRVPQRGRRTRFRRRHGGARQFGGSGVDGRSGDGQAARLRDGTNGRLTIWCSV